MAQTTDSYDASSITALEGLEHVRKRPGMYIGSTGVGGLHHLVYEVVDNSVDEAMAGYATHIDVTLLADGGCEVVDDGRGIPVDAMKDPKLKGMSAVQAVLSQLNTGGKFGGKGYKVSGGLHGVGVSVVNALSVRLRVRGRPRRQAPLHRLRPTAGSSRPSSTSSATRPRAAPAPPSASGPIPAIFETTEFRTQALLERFQMMAFLNRGLEIRFHDQRPGGDPTPTVYKYDGGIVDFVNHVNASKEALFKKVGYFEQAEDDQEVEIAFQWNTGYNTDGLHSFANGIATIEGGMHEEGFKKALTNAVNKYAKAKGLLKEKDENLQGEDIREGLTAIISVRLAEPQFEGQTKAKLGNVSDPVAGRAGHQREAGRLARGEPDRGQEAVGEGQAGGPRPHRGPHGPRRHPAQVRARGRGHARQAQGLRQQRPRRVRAVHRRGRLGRRLGHPGPRPAHPGDPARSAARSSTSSGPASTRCSRTTRSRR